MRCPNCRRPLPRILAPVMPWRARTLAQRHIGRHRRGECVS